MKWMTHQSAALALGLWSRGEPLVVAAMVVGAVLPDALEQAISFGNKKMFFRIHRGVLHWFGWYLALAVLGLFVGQTQAMQGVMGLAFGALSHLLLDALNPTGVPLLPFRDKPRLRFASIKTGSAGEWGLCLLLVLVMALLLKEGRGSFIMPRLWHV